MLILEKNEVSAPDQGRVVAKAAIRAADQLGLNASALAQVIGLSAPSVTRLKTGALSLSPGTKPFELALLLIRVFRSLDAITGGDTRVSAQWMLNENTVLGGRPADLVKTVSGLTDVLSYLDARRAVV